MRYTLELCLPPIADLRDLPRLMATAGAHVVACEHRDGAGMPAEIVLVSGGVRIGTLRRQPHQSPGSST